MPWVSPMFTTGRRISTRLSRAAWCLNMIAGYYPTLHTLFPTLPRGSLELVFLAYPTVSLSLSLSLVLSLSGTGSLHHDVGVKTSCTLPV